MVLIDLESSINEENRYCRTSSDERGGDGASGSVILTENVFL